MSHKLYRLGRWCFTARRRVLALWLLLLVLIGVGISLAGTATSSDFSIPGTQAQTALDDLEQTFPQSAGGAAQIVVHSDDGRVTDDATTAAVRAGLTEVAGLDGVASVTDPYTGARILPAGTDAPSAPTGPAPPDVVEPTRVSDDGSTVYSQIQFDTKAYDVSDDTKDGLVDAMATVDDQPGVETSFGGEVFQERGFHLSIAEIIGILAALLVLAATLRSVFAAFLPIGTALIGVGVATGGLLLSSNVIDVSSSAPALGMMIGLAVGIDYALFLVSRHRELLGEGRTPVEAAARATATAGGAVVFAGATVVIALAGLSVAGIPFLTVMGLGAAASVAIAVCIALTLLPALLGFLGERLRPKTTRKSVEDGPVARRWTRFVTRSRVLVTGGVALFLLLCAIPATSLSLALPDNGDQQAGTTQRVAFDTIAEEFGPGYTSPLTVTADLSGSADPAQTLDTLATELSTVTGVEAIGAAVVNSTGDTAVISVIPQWSADATETGDLVTDLRAQVDDRADWADVDLAVTGPTAVGLDTSERLAGALIPFGAVVIGLSLVLLTLVFRSFWVPFIATMGYLLSTAAAFGAVSLVFGKGWMSGLVGLDHTGPVVSFLPIMLMGVLFGLAMDYQVFLVSRMREHYVHGGTALEAVKAGIRSSGKVVVAAAVIMVAVFAAFVPAGDAVLKPIAFALAVGVAFDAFLVRLTLIPAVMAILGDRAWWLPAWLAKRLPEVDIEGASLDAALARDEDAGSDADVDGDRTPAGVS